MQRLQDAKERQLILVSRFRHSGISPLMASLSSGFNFSPWQYFFAAEGPLN